MDKYGKLLFQSKYVGLKNALAFFGGGIMFLFLASMAYWKGLYYLFASVFILIGLYILIFHGKNGIAIFEEAIVFLGKEERVIQKNEIKSIEYKRIKPYRSLVASYYPVLLLKNNTEIRLNVFYNILVNQNLKKIMKEYLPE